MPPSETPPDSAPLSRGELEIELGRLALVLGNAATSQRAFAARRAGMPHPVIGPFLNACAALLRRTQPRHRAFAVRRLDRLASAAGLGFIGLDVWLAEDAGSPTPGLVGSAVSAPQQSRSRRERPRH